MPRKKKVFEETPGAQLEAEKIRKTRADAILAEMRIAEAEGRLVDRVLIFNSISRHITTVAAMLVDLDKRIARHIPVELRARFIIDAGRDIAEVQQQCRDCETIRMLDGTKAINAGEAEGGEPQGGPEKAED
jgi:phage terminase Nu1 subunit (DNA packaging protein)